MKIFYVYFHDTKKVPIHVDEIINELNKRRHEVHLFTSIKNHKAIKKIFLSGVNLHNLRTLEVRYISEFIFMVLLLPYILFYSLIFRPNVFYSRHSACSIIPLLVSKLFKIPSFIEINDIIQDRHKFLEVGKLKRIWNELYHYINYRLADYFLPVTKKIGNWIIDNYPVRCENIIVCTNGVNIKRFRPKDQHEAKKRYHIPSDSNIVLSLGSLFPWCGIEILIESAPKILEVFPRTFFVIGSGEEPYLSLLKQRAKEEKVRDQFLFYGFIPWDDAAWFISLADVCVSPYLLKSNQTGLSSLRVFSYLACGKPVVGSDVTGLGDMLESNRIGVSFPRGDSDALAKSLIFLMSDKDLMHKMGKRGREFVLQNYSWEKIVDKIEVLFKKYDGQGKT